MTRLGWTMNVAGLGALVMSAVLYRATSDVRAASSPTARAPHRLADTGLYLAGQPGVVDPRNRPFAPQYALWSDGATKARWVYLPAGATIDATDPAEWDFPVGTRFWKEFSFGGRKVETRFLWRASHGRWVFASYVWNADGTEATLAPADGVPGAAGLENGRRHDIPSANDCRACHENRRIEPLGFNALQLSTDRDPNAIHGEPLAAGMITMQTLIAEGRLRTAPGARPDPALRIRTADPETRAVLGYFAVNCGVCHQSSSTVPLLGASLEHGDIQDGDAVAQALASHRTSWEVPGAPAGSTRAIDLDHPERSAMLVRMRSRRPSSQMPPLGTVIADSDAVTRVGGWILHLQRRSQIADAPSGLSAESQEQFKPLIDRGEFRH